MEKRLNFTTRLYKKKIRGWGIPTLLPNGSIHISDGMIKDVISGKADIIVTPVFLLPQRLLVIDYLSPLGTGVVLSKKISKFLSNACILHEKFEFGVSYIL